MRDSFPRERKSGHRDTAQEIEETRNQSRTNTLLDTVHANIRPMPNQDPMQLLHVHSYPHPTKDKGFAWN
jgi:hypothetical protein